MQTPTPQSRPKHRFVSPRVDIDPEDDFNIDAETILDASKKLLAINRGETEPDQRDALHFSRLYDTDKLIAERIGLDADKSIRNTLRRVARQRNLNSITANHFGKLTEGILVGHPLSSPIEETNPMQVAIQNLRVTRMGPGGIPSDDSITPEAQNVNNSIFGFLSPFEGPECFDDKTEVFTDRGWTPWTEVTDDEIFACRIDGRLEWHCAERIIREPYKGELIIGESNTIRMAVTPNHSVYGTSDLGSPYRFKEASDVYGEAVYLPVGHEADPRDHVTTTYVGYWSRQQYDGVVYCATVPGGLLYVRGNPSTSGFWSGNSSRAGVDTRLATGAMIGSDGRIYQRHKDRRNNRWAWYSARDRIGKVFTVTG